MNDKENGSYVDANGTVSWYKENQLHRTDGPAVMVKDGTAAWYENGLLHCEDAPAVVFPNGTQFWYRNGALHRSDGPAAEWANGSREWWVHGIKCSEIEFKKYVGHSPENKKLSK